MVFRMILDAYRDPSKRVWMLRFAAASSYFMLTLGFAVILYLLWRN